MYAYDVGMNEGEICGDGTSNESGFYGVGALNESGTCGDETANKSDICGGGITNARATLPSFRALLSKSVQTVFPVHRRLLVL